MLTVSIIAKSQTPPKPPAWVGVSIGSTKEGVSQLLLSEYSTIVSKYNTTGKEWWKDFEKNILKEDRNRLEQIFKQMSSEQQATQKIAFVQPPPPLKKVNASEREFNDWKNADVYGVWIDGIKVDNAVLNKYKNTEFDQASVSKLYGVAKRNKRYSYQVTLMTREYYRKYYEQTIARGGTRMVFRA